MENDALKYELKVDIEKYHNVELLPIKERITFKRIIVVCLSWVGIHIDLGERFLNAKVKTEEANAIDKMADAVLKLEQAEKLRVETMVIRKKHRL